MIEAGKYKETTQGTVQGGVISPLLANIYLHYVLDLWFEKKFKRQTRGYVELIRYCDDYVVCCTNEEDAKDFLKEMKERLAKFGLEVAEEKTRLIKFGKKAWQESKRNGSKAESFDFLGFTHFHKASRQGYFIMGHKTIKSRLSRSLKEVNLWLKAIRLSTTEPKIRHMHNEPAVNSPWLFLEGSIFEIVSFCLKAKFD